MPKVSVYRGRTHLFDHWIEKPVVVIGRSAEAEIPLDSPAASRKHCRIVRRGSSYTLEEMGAKNGLFVNGQFCNVKALKDGDSIEIADHILTFHWPPSEVREDELKNRNVPGANLRIGQADLEKLLAQDERSRTGELRRDLKGQGAANTTAISPQDLERLLAEAQKKQQAHLEIQGDDGHLRVALDKTRLVLGFEEGVDVLLPGRWIWPWGRRAVEIQALPGGQFKLERLSRWVTVQVNGEAPGAGRVLADRDLLRVGPATMRYQAATELAQGRGRRGGR